jgi:hypothetical protein
MATILPSAERPLIAVHRKRHAPLAAPRGEERPASSFGSHPAAFLRRFGSHRPPPSAPKRQKCGYAHLASLLAGRSSLAGHRGASGPFCCLSRRSLCRASMLVPAARRAARQATAWPGRAHRRRRCHPHTAKAAVSASTCERLHSSHYVRPTNCRLIPAWSPALHPSVSEPPRRWFPKSSRLRRCFPKSSLPCPEAGSMLLRISIGQLVENILHQHHLALLDTGAKVWRRRF